MRSFCRAFSRWPRKPPPSIRRAARSARRKCRARQRQTAASTGTAFAAFSPVPLADALISHRTPALRLFPRGLLRPRTGCRPAHSPRFSPSNIILARAVLPKALDRVLPVAIPGIGLVSWQRVPAVLGRVSADTGPGYRLPSLPSEAAIARHPVFGNEAARRGASAAWNSPRAGLLLANSNSYGRRAPIWPRP